LSTLGRLSRAPLATAMTAGVIGIALALPASLHLAIDNVREVGGGWRSALQVSVFLERGAPPAAEDALVTELRARSEIGGVRVIPPAEALAESRARSGFGEARDALTETPLPAVLVLAPAESGTSSGQLAPLVAMLEGRAGVDFVQL